MTEGIALFHVPGLAKPARTWYKIIGDLHSKSTPLVVLHGGPGACHDYLLPLTDLSVPLVFYDQIGNGKSTHLPERNGDEDFWSVELFKNELNNLLKHLGLDSRPIDVYGRAACSQPNGHLASMDTWRIGITSLRKQLPEDVQVVLDEAEKSQKFETPEYAAAIEVFYKRHLSLARPYPAPEVKAALDWFEADGTTYGTMYGPSELSITGSLRNWTIIPELHNIKVPTLLINAVNDEAQDVTMQPFADNIKNSKWVKLDNAAHFSHVDQRKEYIQHIQDFLE
ncbi:unnamed protein product [Clonostachys rhizophaga]|uniref:AB hydrolase-1 domain-containing protein n=1 Tax=Clonostachys rhizophaga TaxID=160324 RepID=A0A9N9YX29_9HYPO|nr:unnamed protein product [Clonostachys rhizophaga]